jgi:hypothetical protein
MQSNQNDARLAAGGAFVYEVLLWLAVAYVIWLFVRKRYSLEVVWFYTSLTFALLVFLLAGNTPGHATSSAYSTCILLLAAIRFLFLGVGWIVKRISKGKFGVFQTSRVCWIAVGVAVSLSLIVSSIHH